jgi:condensin complex subunit 3
MNDRYFFKNSLLLQRKGKNHTKRERTAHLNPVRMGKSSLTGAIADSFDRCQRTSAAHAGEIQKLRRLQDHHPREFASEFLECLHHVLPVFKREKSAENIVKFVIAFATSDKEHSEHGFTGSDFYLYLVEYLLNYTHVKDKGVRYRCCQILSGLLQNLGEDANLPADLFDLYSSTLLSRTDDKIPDIRAVAVEAVGRLQDVQNKECPIIRKLTQIALEDSSPAVRKSAVTHVAIQKWNLHSLLSRTRDVHDEVRVAAYQTLSKRIRYNSLKGALLRGLPLCGWRRGESECVKMFGGLPFFSFNFAFIRYCHHRPSGSCGEGS